MGKRTIALLTAGGISIVAVFSMAASCDSAKEPYKDTKRSYHDSSYPMSVIRGADGFNNIGTSCDGRGNRVYVSYHGEDNRVALDVVPGSQLAKDDPCITWRYGQPIPAAK